MPKTLAVWLYGAQVATVDHDGGRLRLSYTAAALDRYPLGTPLLSLSLPLNDRRYTQAAVRHFLDGLLPEGEARRTIAWDLGLATTDTFGLIQALGRDCAGAVVLQPEDDPPPPLPTTATAEALSAEALEALVRELRGTPLGIDGRVRISLAGVQDKLVLTRMPDGRWGRPVDGTPSTHILKPGIAAFPDTVANEAFCMRLAGRLGLPVAQVETTEIADRQLIVVQRYDRMVAADGSVTRLHQEDFCQATGTAPDQKYEEGGGPSLRRIAAILATAAAPDSLERLLAAVIVNCLIDNGDAHAKNYSLLHDESGGLRLSPLYDLMCTSIYGDDRLAMFVDDVRRTDRVTSARIVNEATRWGLGRGVATEIVGDLLARVPDAIDAAAADIRDVPDQVVATVRTQLEQLRATPRDRRDQ